MTGAHEITLLSENGIKCAVICMVDNYANGLGPREMSLHEFEVGSAKNRVIVESILTELLKHREELIS